MEYELAIALIALFLLLPPFRAVPGLRRYAPKIRDVGAMLGIAFLFMEGVGRAAYIPSPSMAPTLHVHDRVLVSVLSARLHGAERGTVVVFRSPEDGGMLCKRIVGLPGDVLAVYDGSLWRNGVRLQEPYTNGPTLGVYPPITVPPGHFFAMGDNRNNSHDSRFFGPVPSNRLVGKAEAVFWPLSRVGLL